MATETQPQTLTQGQSYMGGTVQYDTATGKPLAAGATTLSQPAAAPSAPAPVTSPVVSGSTAANYVSDTIKPAMTAANTAITTAQQQAKERSIALAQGQITDQASMDKFKTGQQGATTTQQTTPPSAQDQAATDIANTPEVGYKWAYQKDGTRVQIPINSTATQFGMSDQKPVVAPGVSPTGAGSVETVAQDDGGSSVQFSDGSYGKLDAAGNFIGAISKAQYDDSKLNSNIYQRNTAQKSAADLQTKIDQIINGTYPLSPDQQAQIDSVKQTFQRLIDEQVLANKNYQGGIQVASGLSGLSEYSPTLAMGTLKSAIDSGITKVADLNTKLLSTVSQMNLAFRSDNMKMLNDAYKNYSDYADKKQAELDKITAAAAAHEKDMRDYNFSVEKEKADNEYKDATLALQNDQLTLAQVKQKAEDVLNNKQLSETVRHNLATEFETKQKRLQDAAGNSFDVANTPFASTITTVGRTVGRLDRNNFMSQIADSAKRQDWKTMMTDMKNQVNESLPAADRTKLNAHEANVAYLTNMENLLKQYKAKGGDTGLLVGTSQGIATKYGQAVTDPELIALQTAMNDNFVRFRADITGAAFSPEESKGYEALVPSANKNIDLNLAVIQGARDYAQQQADSTYQRKMGTTGYDNLKGIIEAEDKINTYMEKAPLDVQQKVAQMAADGVEYGQIMKYLNIQ